LLKVIAKFLPEYCSCRCGNNFTYHQGIINDYCSDHFASYYNFISDIIERGSCEITVGEAYNVIFSQRIPIVNKIFLSPHGGSAAVFAEPSIFRNQISMKIISSERKDNLHFGSESIIKVGEKVIINYTIYGRSENLLIEPWRSLLVTAKEQTINKNGLLSYLLSAMALESYANSKIYDYLKRKGIDNSCIEIFLKESNMVDKLFTLFKSIFHIKFPLGIVSREKLTKILTIRNKIAHGKIVSIDPDESLFAFRLVVSFLYELEIKN